MDNYSFIRFLTLKGFDISSEQGRSDERHRLASLSIIANIFSRILSLMVIIFAVKLTVPYLGAERFGIWMTIASFSGMLSFLDLGVGNALTNKVAHEATKNDPTELRSLISGGLGLLLIIGVSVSLVLVGLTCVLPWEDLLKVQDKSLYTEIKETSILFSTLFGLQIISNGVQRIFAGLQKSYESHLINAAGSVLSIISLLYVINQKEGIFELLAVTFGCQILFGISSIILLVYRNYISFTGIIYRIKKETPELFKTGGLFFLLQIGVMVASGSDSLIISSNLGVEAVAMFTLTQRLFQFASQPMNIMNAPLWSAYADANSRGDIKYIKSSLISSIRKTTIFSVLATLFLIEFGANIIELWTGKAISIPITLVVSYGIWAILEMIGNAFGVFLNGCGIVRQQVVNVLIFSLTAVLVKLYAIHNYGLEAMLYSSSLTYVVVTAIMYGFIYKTELHNKLFQEKN